MNKSRKQIFICLALLMVLLMNMRVQEARAQFIFEGSIGVAFPYDQLKGSDYVRYDTSGYIFIDSSLFANNFGAQPGLVFSGSAKYSFDKLSITRAVFSITYTGFNSFQARRSGTTLVKFVNNTYQPRSIEYNYSFSNVGLGVGVEIAPTSFTKILSPFFGANMNFNFLTADLTRRSGNSDSVGANLNSFRMGFNFSAGLEIRLNNTVGLTLGAKYDLANVLLKNTERDGFIEWGSKDASLNDEEGRYISNLYYPIGEAYNYFQSQPKNLNWGTVYAGVSYNPFYKPPAKKKPVKKNSSGHYDMSILAF